MFYFILGYSAFAFVFNLIREIQKDMADVKALNVRKTPGYFVNGKPLQVFGYKQLQQLIYSELDAQYPN